MSLTSGSDSKICSSSTKIYGGALLLIIVSFLAGIAVSHGNADQVCRTQQIATQSSICTNGSWSDWSVVSRNKDNATGEESAVEERTYTGTMQSVSGSVTTCSRGGSSSSYTSQYNVCQVKDTRSRVTVAATKGGNGNGGGNGTVGTVYNYNQTVTVGAATGTATSFSGSAAQLSAFVNANLATTTLSVIPSLVRPGDSTRIIWNSSYVGSCQVTGTNGDSWNTTASPAQGQRSGVINQQTVYTLSCDTSDGRTLRQQATVNVIPTYKEN